MKYVQSQQRYQGDVIDVIVRYLEFCVRNEIYCRKHAVETIIVNKITKHVIGKELLTLSYMLRPHLPTYCYHLSFRKLSSTLISLIFNSKKVSSIIGFNNGHYQRNCLLKLKVSFVVLDTSSFELMVET